MYRKSDDVSCNRLFFRQKSIKRALLCLSALCDYLKMKMTKKKNRNKQMRARLLLSFGACFTSVPFMKKSKCF